MLTFEEFAWRQLWFEQMRLSRYISEVESQRSLVKLVRRAKRGAPLFDGPFGDKSMWANMNRDWYKHYLEQGD